GYKTGLFTSPYIEAFEERIRVNGANVARDDLARATLEVRRHASAMEAACGEHPTEFELMTAVALEHFRAQRCDIVVLEVGLGGRLDSTNVIDAPEVSVICRIGLDHTALLGDTLVAVAGEKAGIVKRGAPVVSWPQELEAMRVVEKAARERGCTLTTPDFTQLELGVLDLRRGTRAFAYKGVAHETRMLGSYQPQNAALAIEALDVLRKRGWDIPAEAVRTGIARATWPGRFEVVSREPLTIVDGGHNPQGAEALANSLVDALGGEQAARGRCVFVMGVLADKDYSAMIRAVSPLARAFVAYAPSNPRALSAAALAETIAQQTRGIHVEAAASPAEAVERARQLACPDDVLVAFGTLYSIADVKAAL
ncbi:MAG: cyanophycin synthetase, partial [Eggerthellaceae bacterium]|nr:cyanophycin synthetase [Eggerthellaceae bacterium]